MAPKTTSISETLHDLWDLLRAYAKQETIDPLKSLGRYLGFGLGGSALISLGLFFLALSLLRALQTQTGEVFQNDWSFVPYLIVVVVLGLVAVIAVTRITKGQHNNPSSTNALPEHPAAAPTPKDAP